MNATPKVLHRLLSNLDTTFHSNLCVFLSIYDSHLARKRWILIHSPTVLHRLLCTLDKTLHSTTQVCSHAHTHTHIQLRGKRWSYKHRWLKHVHLRKFGTHRFEILTQRCIPIRASVHICVKSICGWEAVEPQSRKILHRLVSNFDTPLHSNTRVFLYTGWDGTGRHVMGRDGMGRNGMALSHSNAWPGTASNK
jgi:hypothetical protein